MAYYTTSLGLQLADPTTTQVFETAVVNEDFQLLNDGIVADRTRLTSLEGHSTTFKSEGTSSTVNVSSTARELLELNVPTIVGHTYGVLGLVNGSQVGATGNLIVNMAWATSTNSAPATTQTGTKLNRMVNNVAQSVGPIDTGMAYDTFVATTNPTFVKVQASASAGTAQIAPQLFVSDLGTM